LFSDGVSCKTYLADRFEVVLFDSNQKKTASKTFQCSADTSSFSVYVPKEKYYITVALKDKAGNNKSYGSGFVDATVPGASVDIEMNEYLGGVTFEWGTSFCNKYDVGILKITLLQDDDPVSTIIWGELSLMDKYEMNCNSGYLEVVNIPSGMYVAEVEAYRDSSSKRPRILFDVEEFKLTSGHQTPLEIDNYKEVVVSDLIIEWDFDSKSIESCSDTAINKIVADISSAGFEEDTEVVCSDSMRMLYFYDLPAGSYDISVSGIDGSGKTVFTGSKSEYIEVGKIGKDAVMHKIYIFEE
jgi:hypothetical protein